MGGREVGSKQAKAGGDAQDDVLHAYEAMCMGGGGKDKR